MSEHHHHHGHSHAPADFGRAFAIGIGLNIIFVVAEAGYGIMSGSLALVADAGHNMTDVMTLLLAWGASVAAKRPATARHTYGFKKATILASLISALMLYIAVGVIIWEAIARLRSPVAVNGGMVMAIAALGVVINTATALLFVSGRKDDLNIKGAFLHMAADAVVSLGVVGAGFAIRATGWNWLDPLVSLIIAVIILAAGWGLLKDSLHLSMAGTPAHIDPEAVRNFLARLTGVGCVHDLHIWAAGTTENVLTAHLVMPDGGTDDFLHDTAHHLRDDFGIQHTTLQIERQDNDGACHVCNRQGGGQCWPSPAT
jgi:cobalt-zinc-cadmium efflux system protein